MEQVLGLDTVSAIVVTGLVAGGVELIKKLFEKEWRVAIIIAGAGIIGGLAGLVMGVGVLEGIVYGLATSGYITIAQNIGKDNREY